MEFTECTTLTEKKSFTFSYHDSGCREGLLHHGNEGFYGVEQASGATSLQDDAIVGHIQTALTWVKGKG